MAIRFLFLLVLSGCMAAAYAQPGTQRKENTREMVIGTQRKAITALEFSPDGKYLLIGSANGTAKLWNLRSNKMRVIEHRGSVNDATFSPDGTRIATACSNNRAYLWSLRGDSLNSYVGHSDKASFHDIIDGQYGISGVSFSADGKQLLTGSQDQTARVWKTNGTHEVVNTYGAAYTSGGIMHSDYSALGAIVYGDQFGRIFLAQHNGTAPGPAGQLSDMRFSPDGQWLAVNTQRKADVSAIDFTNMRARQPGSTGYIQLFNSAMNLVTTITTIQPTAVRFSNKNRVAIGKMDGSIELYDTQGKAIGKFAGHNSDVQVLAFSPDGSRLASTGSSGSICLWEVTTERLIATIYPADNATNDFIVVLPNQYYYNTSTTAEDINFRIAGKLYPLETFDLYYNRPHTVLAALGYASESSVARMKAAWHKRLEVMELSPATLEKALELPSIAVERGTLTGYTTTANVAFTVSASAATVPLKALHVTVNGVPLHGRSGTLVSDQKQFPQTVELELGDGKNLISVWAENQLGVNSYKEQFTVFCDSPKNKPALYFIGIASGEFAAGNEAHEFNAAADLDNVLRQWKQHEGSTFSRIHTTVLNGEEVTPTAVRKLHSFLAESDVDDVVILYFVGHGLLDETNGNYYLSSYHIAFDNPSQAGIPYESLEQLLDQTPSRKRLMLINACNSGEYNPDPDTFDRMKRIFTDLRVNSGAYVISSSRSIEASVIEGESGTVFGHALQQIMQEHKTIKASELKMLIHQQTKRDQTPTMRQTNRELDFVVW